MSQDQGARRLSPTLTGGPTELPSELMRLSPPPFDAPALEALGGRYDILDHIAQGGMGEVWRVYDRLLGTTLAMKVISARAASSPVAMERFRAEARVAASLQHPGTVPVHDLGELSDGRPFYTMMEVQGGRELRMVFRGLWTSPRAGPDGVELRRLVDVLHRVSSTVGFAHERGLVHLDLKPSNIMLGRHGEVLVMDWGLARAISELKSSGPLGGTPGYMGPEQAAGRVARIGPRADVYALGAMLAEILTGRPPPRPGSCDAPGAPSDLVELAQRATAADPAERPATASDLAAELRSWLDGARRQERAAALTREADDATEAAVRALAEAQRLATEHARLEEAVRPWEGPERKRPVWHAADALDQAERAAERAVQAAEQGYAAALREHPEHGGAHHGLARLYHRLHADAEARGEARAAARYLSLLRAHDRGWFADYLRGMGTFSLLTDPPGATVTLSRIARRDLRLVPEDGVELGRTPLRGVELPMGRYLAELRAPGRATVRLPVQIERGGHSDSVPPGALAPAPVPLPEVGALGDEDVYVPPGWARAGGDGLAMYALPATRVWLDGFIIRRHPVTNREYVRFLNEVLRRSGEAAVAPLLPRVRPGPRGLGAAFYERDAEGAYRPVPDAEGDLWDLDWPVLFVDLACATAFAEAEAERTGQPWRLPTDLEWEKAARGVDGRLYPWGDDFDATFACLKDSRPGRPLPCRTDEFPLDESPYGVRALAGNARCWCGDRFESDAPAGRADEDPDHVLYATRGGSWTSVPRGARSARRYGVEAISRTADLGIRLVRSWP